MCRVLEVKEGSYYAWRKRGVSKRARSNAQLREELLRIARETKQSYGSRRSTQFLRSAGVFVNRKRVAKLMRDNDIRPTARTAKPTMPIGTADGTNILDRRFRVTEPNRYWASDITYIPTRQGWLYLAVTMDLYSRRIIGWSMDCTRSARLVFDALSAAVQLRRPKHAFVHHTDRGTQYTSTECIGLLARSGGIASLSRKGNCWDNAVVESFFATLKRELDQEVYRTRDEARLAVFEYIEGWYNPTRLHSTLGYKSPIAFEQQSLTP
jgi:transposase InsO family protein